jgi:hypothetical protein
MDGQKRPGAKLQPQGKGEIIDAQPPLPSSPYYKEYMEEEERWYKPIRSGAELVAEMEALKMTREQAPSEMTNDQTSHDPSECGGRNGGEGETPNTKHQTSEKLQTSKGMTKDEDLMTKEAESTKGEGEAPGASNCGNKTSNIEHPTPNFEVGDAPSEMTNDETVMAKECRMTNDQTSHDPSECGVRNGGEGETPNTKLQTSEKLQTPAQMTNDQNGAPKPDETQKAAANGRGTKPGDQGAVSNTKVEEPVAVPAAAVRKYTENGTSHDGTYRIVGWGNRVMPPKAG